MKLKKNIYLIGMMGSGKTSIGKRLSCILKVDFFDSDMEIITQTGASINYIFDIEGETGFRKRETKVIKELCQRKNIVLSTGGGAVLSEENQQQFKNGTVIYLNADINILVNRIKNSKNRPLLENNPKETLEKIFIIRDPIYRKIADLVVDTKHKKIYAVIKEIKQFLKTI
ncbi:Shikimate kinase I [hydrothermal vent metagenome]|uniref:shikimate kinase n=1 Tax=hydrothermal vent metagenome TaxID=652676 RepID=A0A1W1CQ49_9ZZZZ